MATAMSALTMGAEVQVNSFTAGEQTVPVAATFPDGTSLVLWNSWGEDGSGVGVYARRLDFDGNPIGAAYRVNTTTLGNQAIPTAAIRADGSHTIYWQDGSGATIDVRAQSYDAAGNTVGGETVISTTGGGLLWPSSGDLADGGNVVVWTRTDPVTSQLSVRGRRFDADGDAVGDDFLISNVSAGASANVIPRVVGLSGGGFVAFWHDVDGSSDGSYAQLFDASGNAVGGTFRVNTTTASTQKHQNATALHDGGFVVTWTSSGQDGSSDGIYAQRFDANGAKVGGEFRVNSTTTGGQYDSRIATMPDGGFVVTFTGQDGSGPGIFARRFDPEGVPVGTEFRVNTTTGGYQQQSALTIRDDGSFLVAWASPDASGQGIVTRVISPTIEGFLPTGDRRVNTTQTDEQTVPYIATFADGTSLAVWNSAGGQDGDGSGVFGQRMDSNGAKIGGEFRINTTTTGNQTVPVITTRADGTHTVYWQDSGAPATIRAQSYDAAGNAVGGEAVVNTSSGVMIRPYTGVLEDGGHAVVWYEADSVGTPIGVRARLYDADGAALGDDFSIGTVTNGVTVDSPPAVAGLQDGGFVAFWRTSDGNGAGVYGRRFTADGQAQGGPFQVNTFTTGDQRLPSAVGMADGGFVVTWTSTGQDGGGLSIQGQRYDAAGAKIGGEFQVNTLTAANQYDSRVVALHDGGFMVSYTAGDSQDGNGAGVFLQRFDRNAAKVGPEIRFTDVTTGNQQQTILSARADGGIAAVWAGPDLDGQGVLTRVLNPVDPYDVITGTAGADTLSAGSQLAWIAGGDGNDLIHGGSAADRLDGGAGNDTIFAGDGDVATGGAGFDTLWYEGTSPLLWDVGGAGFEEAHGGSGNDSLSSSLSGDILLDGGAGNDTLSGGAGNDTLDGGVGADSLIGGAGDDTYVVDDAGDGVVENTGEGTDTVLTDLATYTLPANVENLEYTGSGDFAGTGNGLDNAITGGSGNDTLDGGGGADTLIGGTGNDTYVVDDAGDVVVENTGEGTDTVRTSLNTYTLPENVEHLTYTGSGNFTGTGNGSANTLTGGAGSDTLSGLGGNDWLDGGAGTDSLIGGTGNDTYVVDDAGDVVIENAGEGTDTVRTSLNTYTLPDNVENVVFTGSGDFAVTGNDQNNSLTGGSGQDTLIGLAGNDTLNGGSGADSMIGGTGNDTYTVDDVGDVVSELPGEGTDTVRTGLGTYTLGDDVENLTHTGSSPFTGTGNELDNSLTGGSGVDTLFGLDGNDTLNGGSGADSLIGGTGDDTYIVDNAGDVVTELSGEGADTVKSGITYTLPENVENLILTGSNDIDGTGNGLDNTITGNGGANTLDGDTGADTLIGGAGDDTYIVDDAGDLVTENAGQGFDELRTDLSSYTLPANVEKLTYTGTGDFAGTGNGLDNVLNGAGGNDTLSGGDGDDTLSGGAGADVLDGGNGSDTADYATSGQAVAVDLGAGTASGGDAAGDTLTSIENLTGSAHDDVLTGDGGDNVLIGGAGADTLTGGGGTDTAGYAPSTSGVVVDLASGAGTAGDAAGDVLSGIENLTGGAYDDVLRGDGGANLLDGGAGNDTLEGRGGDDTLIGGSGTDTAVFSGNVADYLATDDGGTWTFTDPVGGDGTDTLIGVERVQFADRLIYLDGTNNAPIVSENLSETTDEDAAPLAIDLLQGAWDFDGDAVSVTGLTQTAGWSVTATLVGGVLTIDPGQLNAMALGESETLVFTYGVTDGTDATTRTLSVTVEGRNDAPTVAAVLSASTDEDAGVVNLNLLQGADDVDNGASLSVTGLTQTGGASVGVTLAGGVMTFDPDQLTGLGVGESEVLTFAYDVTDGTASTPQTLTVTVDGRNDAPTAGDDVVYALYDTPLTLAAAVLLYNDTDPDASDSPSITSVGNAAHGTVSIDVDGNVVFTADTGFSGQASFEYTVTDGHGGTDTATVTVAVASQSAGGTALVAEATRQINFSYPNADVQALPFTAQLASGEIVAVWARRNDGSGDGIQGQRFAEDGTPIGSHFAIATNTSLDQLRPNIAALPDGGFLVTWESVHSGEYNIRMQRFDSSFAKVGGEQLVNTYIPSNQNYSEVTVLADDGWVVQWGSNAQDGSGWGVYQQRYDATGAKLGGEERVNSYVNNTQDLPRTAALDDGGWVTVWRSNGQDGSSWGAYQQRFAADGSRVGGETLINDVTADTQNTPVVAALSGGRWLVTWASNGADADLSGVVGKIFAADGTVEKSEFLINGISDANQVLNDVATLADGGFVVVWASGDYAGYNQGQIHGQRYDANGDKVGETFRIDDFPAMASHPTVTALDNGGFTVSWHTRHSTSTFDTDIYMRVFSPTTATPEVVSRDGYVAVGGAVSATEMVSMGHPQGAAFVESGLHPKTLFEFEDASATDSSGYLTLDGLRWAANTPLRIAAGDLDRVGWNGGAALGEQTFRVRGYDGTEWSDWAEGSMRTVGSLDTVHAVNGQQQVNFQIANGDSQDVPSLAQLADGTTLAVWSRRNDGSGSGVLAQRFAADGTPIGGHFTFATTTTGNQLRPSVAALADGGFVINWESDHSGDWNVRQQRYDAAFQKVGGEQLVNTYTSSSQNYAMNTALADGGWLVTWGSNSQDGSSWGVYQQRYASSGAKVGGETRVNTHTADLQYNQQVAALADGGWLVTWASNGQDGSYIGVYQRRYAADGSAVGGEQLVNQNTSDSQHQPRVAVLADGGWVVSWNSSGQDMSGNGAYARVFNADGSSRTDEFRLSQSGDGNQYLPGVAALDDGGFVAVWSQGNPIASSAAGVAEVHGRRFDADGVAIGEEFRIDQTAGSTDMANVFAVDGGFQVMWQNWNGADTYSTNVYSRFYTTDAVPMDVQVGTDGADVLFGSNGADTLTGGLGADVFHFESPDVGLDVITDFQAGIDVIEVVSANFDDLAVGQLDASRFALGTVADADTRFVFDTATKVLSYDADGTGAGAAVGLASLNVSTLSNVNIVVVS